MKINFNKEVIDLITDQPFLAKYKSQEDFIKATIQIKDKDGKEVNKIDEKKLHKETIGRVLIVCIANFIENDLSDGFYAKQIVNIIKGAEEGPEDERHELKDKLMNYIERVIKQSVIREVDGKVRGVYPAWILVQVAVATGLATDETQQEVIEKIKESKEEKN